MTVTELHRTCAREGCCHPARVRWCSDRCKWAARPREARDQVAFIRHLLVDLGDSVGAGDPVDLLPLAELGPLFDRVLAAAIESQKANSACTWAEIGAALGISRQAAQQRFERRRRRAG